MTQVKKFHWIPDTPDIRDFVFAETFKPEGLTSVKAAPPSVDLRASMSPVEDQSQLGSCTANAVVGALEFLEIKTGAPFVDLSRLFVYYNERVLEGTTLYDSGATLRDGIKTLSKQGVCPEKEWPYVISKYTTRPTPQCYADAAKRKITSYHRLNSLDDMKVCLASGYPFVFGFTVYTAFMSNDVAYTGVLNMPKKGEKVLGGHAVCAVGYDNSTKRFLIRNSWGASWGMKGYFTMPYDYLSERNLSDDFWVVQK